ncbi:MAG: outer membrane lipoprotein-sorting protein, partial [Bacteroidota bacterium]
AIKRVKRISSSNKSGPFMGSEFAYEDLSSFEIEKFTYKFLEENGDLLMVEQYPKGPQSGYTRRIVSYNQAKNYRIEQIEFYDRKGSLLKTLLQKDYKLYKNKFWRASEFEMVNHQTGKATSLFFNAYDFDTKLSNEDFTQVALKRAGN